MVDKMADIEGQEFPLFQALLEDYQTAVGDTGAATIPCPLCLELFGPGAFTVEHVIPSALGFSLLTLTCASCNCPQGSRLERHLVSAHSSALTLNFDAKIIHDSKPIRVLIRWPEDEREPVQITAIEGASDPAVLQSFKEYMDGSPEKISLQVKARFAENKRRLALMRAAYLALFKQFGYAWVLDSVYVPVRAAFNQAQLEWNNLHALTPSTANLSISVHEPLIIDFTAQLRERSVLVVLPLGYPKSANAAAILPMPGVVWEQFLAAAIALKNTSASCTHVVTGSIIVGEQQ